MFMDSEEFSVVGVEGRRRVLGMRFDVVGFCGFLC